MDLYGLKLNPFELKNVSDISDFKANPFLLSEVQKHMQTAIHINATSEESKPLYYVVHGERGIGKTSTLFFLKDYLDNLRDISIVTRYVNSIKNLGTLHGMERVLICDDETNNKLNVKKRIEKFLQGRKVYLFIDVPENTTKDELKILADGLQLLLNYKEIRVIIAMNIKHYDMMYDVTEILGKYMVWELRPFSIEETKTLMLSRLNHARKEPRDDLYPFTEDSVPIIHALSKGIPRNILMACDMCFTYGVMNELDEINKDVVSEVLREDYANKVIMQRVSNDKKRKVLMELYDVLKEVFQGEVKGEKFIMEYMQEEYGWSPITTRNRLRLLERLGLITITKDEDTWTNIIRVL